MICQHRVMDDRTGADAAVLPDDSGSRNARERADDGIDADIHLGIHRHGLRPFDGDAVEHQPAHFARAQNAVGIGQFHAVVDAQNLAGIGRSQRCHAYIRADQDRDHVGEVVFAGGIVGPNPVDVIPERRGFEAVDSGIDFAHGKLRGGAGFMFDNFANAAIRAADNSSVAGRIRHFGGEQSCAGGIVALQRGQFFERLGADQGAIAHQNDQPAAEVRQLLFAAHDGVSGTQLPGLMNGADAGRFSLRANGFRLMTHHDEYALRRGDLKRRIDGMPDQRFAAGRMQHFGHAGLHARALPRGKNQNCGVIQHHFSVSQFAQHHFSVSQFASNSSFDRQFDGNVRQRGRVVAHLGTSLQEIGPQHFQT